ncbi:hypothetical protein [Haladaptatus sp. NG-WS-4]
MGVRQKPRGHCTLETAGQPKPAGVSRYWRFKHAEEIRAEKAQFAHRMGESDDDNISRAEPFRMFQ